MATKDFAHLHVHTEYSMLDGAARLGDLFSYAKELGMSSMATSDHGFLFGAFDFWRQAKAHDIKPIIGVEAYLTPARTAPTAPACAGAMAPAMTCPAVARTPT